MRILVNGKMIGKLDNRFNEKIWTDGSSDSRVCKSKAYAKRKHARKVASFKNELKRTFALIAILGIVTGFIYLRLAGI